MIRQLFLLVALLMTAALAEARTNAIQPELVAEGPAPSGGEVELAIVMRTSPGWHGYWLNPGDAGLPMEVQWKLPRGFAARPLRYPVPSRLEISGLMNYVYGRDYALLVRLKVPADAQGIIPIRAAAHWLACTDKICVPEQGQLALDLPVGTGSPGRARFDGWRKALPRPLATPGHFAVDRGLLRVAIPLPESVAVGQPYLYPVSDGVIDYDAKQSFRRAGDTLVAELKARGPLPARFDGVLALGDGDGFAFAALSGQVPEGGKLLGEAGFAAVLAAVLGALAGGVLLNLMPCVFPILALKTLHVARAGESPRAARRDALAYAAGAIAGTGALGLALLAIRAAGTEAGWAFQLQDPRTIMLLLLLAVAIAANLLGLFELPVLGGRLRPGGGFATGALAAFVATPCAGPFLGAALGTALLLPTVGAVMVFAALGLGLALPFVVLAFVPRLVARLPKPGAWMQRLQRFLAIPMAATAVACLWLIERQAGERGLLFALFASAALAICLYFAGRIQRGGGSRAAVALVCAALVVVAAVAWVPAAPAGHPSAPPGAQAWSEGEAERLVAQGHPVLVYFTADWCLTCKANEAAAINRSQVRDLFEKRGVKVLAGDWTSGDPAITRFLEAHGRAGVPYYLWYAPGTQPEELPQLLTPSMLISRARQATR
ncbi:MAG: protein-disulfide reductase DsbD domain-containing protein [Sphingomicrobium sp.]